MRVVFLGTPEFAVPSLQALAQAHEVAAVFTQPDRPKGRGNQLAESPVKSAAKQLGIPLYQPERIRRPENVELLAALQAEMMIVVGYGQIIPQTIIDLPRYGILNVHASLLPKYRGAAPIQWAIANGETKTGVTIMQIDAGLDTGDMLLKAAVEIGPDDTATSLSAWLAPLGANLLLTAIEQIAGGVEQRERQNAADASMAPILKKEDAWVDWQCPAWKLRNRLRGFTPWPGVHTTFRGQQLSITQARTAEPASGLTPGVLKAENRRVLVGCGENTALELLEIQLAGKKRMTAEALLNGYKFSDNERLGDRA
jgi:methionyl-tRNA formyltransferase